MFCLKEYHSYTKDADEQDLHGWLPVQHMQGHETGIMQCPCCAHPDKMMEHLFQCTNSALMLKKETLLIIDIRKKGIAKGVPQAIMEALCRLLYDFIHSNTVTVPVHPTLEVSVRSQISLGIRLLPRGILSEQWLTALQEFLGVDHPERKKGLLKLVWFEFTDTILRNRNEIAHEGGNRTRELEQATWATKLLWYLENKHVIARRDQFLLTYTEEDIEPMPRLSRRKMVQNLERLKAVYARELQICTLGQRTIHSYFATTKSQGRSEVEMGAAFGRSLRLRDRMTLAGCVDGH